MIPPEYRGSPPTQCPALILDVVRRSGASRHEIYAALSPQYAPRTINYHLSKLVKSGELEQYYQAPIDMRSPKYRGVKR